MPKGWTPRTWSGKADFAVESAIAHSGRNSVRISSAEGADASWYTVIPLRPYSPGTASAAGSRPKTSSRERAGELCSPSTVPIFEPRRVVGTQDWTRLELVFDSGANDALWLNCLFGGWGKATGPPGSMTSSSNLIRSARTLKPRSYDRRGEDCSRRCLKYIYGQFIEHLGRCIYGGIWAEMLEDRKFFYAGRTHRNRPGRPSANRTSVWHESRPFPMCGEHAVGSPAEGERPARRHPPGRPGRDRGERVRRPHRAGRPTRGALPVEVSLVWGDGPNDRQTVALDGLCRTSIASRPVRFHRRRLDREGPAGDHGRGQRDPSGWAPSR